MAIICPTVLAEEPHDYRAQMERIQAFAQRIQIDLVDGTFAPNKSVSVEQAWWPESIQADVHLMYQRPQDVLDKLIELKPNLVILHAEAEGNFAEFADKLHANGIKVGLALLAKTEVASVKPALDLLDHVLIFSGDLGHFGGHADLSLLGKASELKSLKPSLEIGWDGGINDQNAKALVSSGVDVLNVGGFIQKAERPEEAYATLKGVIEAVNP